MRSDIPLLRKSIDYRRKILKYIHIAGAGHTGGSLSCVDILNVLYNRILNVTPESFGSSERDRYIQSKGHSAEALYVVLADQGFFPESDLKSLCAYNSRYMGHPTRKVAGIEHNTGALGHGLPFAVGCAIAGKMDDAGYRVFCLLGDGELAEGSNWEAAMCASHMKLDNLVAIIDHNSLQITGPTAEVMSQEPLCKRWEAFGWSVCEAPGHDLGQLEALLQSPPWEPGKPSLLIANTTKGKGVRLMENNKKWHHGVPSDEQLATALKDLDEMEQLLEETSS